eukprot:CAMPEP_0117458532 /NCGR_PEP_ID=MMETSP0784-20121206/983_1 /TAXON_ID=39447 /ORGANISM="" /LENGTH=689 /DNA_ID=CAMNT_0005252061 /DNA_START=40 /DNA_END=2106 /DNA_ORIENTATION=-
MPAGVEKEPRRRRHATSDDAAPRKSSWSFFMKAMTVGITLIVLFSAMHLFLLTRHLDSASGLGGATNKIWRQLTSHSSDLKVITQQQQDLLRLTAALGESLQKQHEELKKVEERVAFANQHDAGVSREDTMSAKLHEMQKNVEEMQRKASQPPMTAAHGPPVASASSNAERVAPPPGDAAEHSSGHADMAGDQSAGARPNAGVADSSGGPHVFPQEWLARFSQKELEASASEAEKWRKLTKDAFLHAWNGYRKHAWGADEFNPTTGRPARVWANCGMQIIDALSTIWIMGLMEEFDAATKWVEQHLHWDHAGMVSFFEITIRALGGLASAHALSGREIFLKKARELADKMLPAFNKNTGWPSAQVNLRNGVGGTGWFHGTILAEAGTIQLEFRYLSQQTGNPVYAEKADRSMRSVFEASKGRPLVPWGLSQNGPPHLQNQHVTFGAMGDSYYEYLLKMWVQTDKIEPEWKNEWKKAMHAMHDRLILKTNGQLTYVAEENNGRVQSKMDHLACFVGGMLIYGARTLPKGEVDPRWETTAEGITETCYQMYHRQPSHLAPECVTLKPRGGAGRDMEVWNNAGHYLLRPEAAEAIFYMFYYTGDPKYRRMAGEIIEAIEAHTKTAFGYSAVGDVRMSNPRRSNSMETFFLAETLKYLYLTFVPNPRDVLNLDEFVFNTEAHPIRIKRYKGRG